VSLDEMRCCVLSGLYIAIVLVDKRKVSALRLSL